MKEKYVKPVIMIERFSLTQSIAVACGSSVVNPLAKHNHSDAFSCAWIMPEGSVFTNADHGCVDIEPDPDNVDFWNYCYNNPTADMLMFGSV